MIAIYVIAVVATIGLAVCLFALFRNNIVFRERSKLIKEVSAAASADISRGDDWQWRWHEFEMISYMDMLWSFKHPRKMYSSLNFIDPNARW